MHSLIIMEICFRIIKLNLIIPFILARVCYLASLISSSLIPIWLYATLPTTLHFQIPFDDGLCNTGVTISKIPYL